MMVNQGGGKAFLATCGKTFDEIEINFSSFCSIVSISLRIISLIGFFQISEVLLRNIYLRVWILSLWDVALTSD